MLKIILLILIAIFLPIQVYARTTPEDIVNSKKEAYESKVRTYSQQNREKLESLSSKIAAVNKARTAELNAIMARQGEILDEYEKRRGIQGEAPTSDNFKQGTKAEQARYWLTFAHEAIDYQAAKIYVYNLTSEGNIKNDALNLISNLQSELNYARGTAIKSQNLIEDLVATK